MMRSKFYVCPVCGNGILALGQAVVSCCGITLPPLQPEEADEEHPVTVSINDGEYYVTVDHPMQKDHFITCIIAVSDHASQFVKLYPEGNAEARFQVRGVRRLMYYCNRDGLFSIDVHRAIDAHSASYDDSAERRALERTAALLFK